MEGTNVQFALIVAVIGLLLTAVGVVAAVYELIERKLTPLQTTPNDTAETVTEIKVSLFGPNYDNGLRSEVRELKTDVKRLNEDLSELRHRVDNVGQAVVPSVVDFHH